MEKIGRTLKKIKTQYVTFHRARMFYFGFIIIIPPFLINVNSILIRDVDPSLHTLTQSTWNNNTYIT